MNQLLELVGDLVEALERRESADPDFAAWEAERDVQRLERELVAAYAATRRSRPETSAADRRSAILAGLR